MTTREYRSPCGPLLLGVHGSRLCLCDWMVEGRIEKTLFRIGKYLPPSPSSDRIEVLDEAARQLDEYFRGERVGFTVPLMPLGTAFRNKVWEELRKVPFGITVSYLDIAAAAGLPASVRVVAGAIGANPLSIFIPCHRVLGSDGSLTGYAGGLPAKSYLLKLECLKKLG